MPPAIADELAARLSSQKLNANAVNIKIFYIKRAADAVMAYDKNAFWAGPFHKTDTSQGAALKIASDLILAVPPANLISYCENFVEALGDKNGALISAYREDPGRLLFTLSAFAAKDNFKNFDLTNRQILELCMGIATSKKFGDESKDKIMSSPSIYNTRLKLGARIALIKHVISQETTMQKYTDKYGVRPMRITGFLDGKIGIGDDAEAVKLERKAKGKIFEVAAKLNIAPEFLAAAFFQEGGIMFFTDPRPDYGFNSISLGFDSFGLEMGKLKKKGYLRPGFSEENGDIRINVNLPDGKTFLEYSYNEKGMKVLMVDFKDISSAIEAFGAILAGRRDAVLARLKRTGADPGAFKDEQIWAGTYLYYNTGSFNMLEKALSLKPYKGNPVDASPIDAMYNCMRVVSTAKYLSDSNVLNAQMAEYPKRARAWDEWETK